MILHEKSKEATTNSSNEVKWPLHPVCEIFPPMSSREFEALKEDITKNGVQQKIISWRGQIIDGQHRIKACEELGRQWGGFINEIDDDQDPVSLALSFNLHRRRLSQSQLAMIAEKVRGMYEDEAKERQKEATVKGNTSRHQKAELPVEANSPQLVKRDKQSRDKAAEAVGVSGKLADAAQKVRRHGVPELVKAVESGEVAVTAAAEVATLPPEEQQEAVKSNTVKKVASAVRTAKKNAKRGDGKQAAQATCRDLKATVSAFLKTNPKPEELEPVILVLDEIMKMVEGAAQ